MKPLPPKGFCRPMALRRPPVASSLWSEIGKRMSPMGSGPNSLSDASIAAEPGRRLKLRLAGSRNRGSPKTGLKFRKMLLVLGTSRLLALPKNRLNSSSLPWLLPSTRNPAPPVWLELAKMLFIARKWTCDSALGLIPSVWMPTPLLLNVLCRKTDCMGLWPRSRTPVRSTLIRIPTGRLENVLLTKNVSTPKPRSSGTRVGKLAVRPPRRSG
jgi:hypothetical protein